MNIENVKHVDIQMSLQSNNKKIVNTNIHYGSIIYRDFKTEVTQTNNIYSVKINKSDKNSSYAG